MSRGWDPCAHTCILCAVLMDIGGSGILLDSLDNVLTFLDWLRISTASDGSCALRRCRLLWLSGLIFLSSISFADGFGG